MSQLVQFVPQLLPEEECSRLLEFSERCGFLKQRFGSSYPAEIRHRVAVDDASIAHQLWILLQPRLRPLHEYFSDQLIAESRVNVPEYSMVGLNERLRFYKYHEGERFARHADIAFEKSASERSLLSVIIYLNQDFDGGETIFDDSTIGPRTGSALVFAHDLMHEGLTVSNGIKRVLRTDVMGELRHAG